MLKYLLAFLLALGLVFAFTGSSDNFTSSTNIGGIGFTANSTNFTLDAVGSSVAFENSTYTAPAAETQIIRTSGGSSSGGGGGGYKPPQVTSTWDTIDKNELITMSITGQKIAFRNLTFQSLSDLKNVQITVTVLEAPSNIYSKEVYQYLEVELHNIKQEDMKNIKVHFNIDADWLNDNDLNYNQIVLLRFDETLWEPLTTQLTWKDGYNDYLVGLDHLSLFAISYTEQMTAPAAVVEPPGQEPVQEPAEVVEVIKPPQEEPVVEEPAVIQEPADNMFYFYIFAIIMLTLVVGILVVGYWPVHQDEQLKHLILWANQVAKRGYDEDQIKEMMRRTGYKEEQIEQLFRHKK